MIRAGRGQGGQPVHPDPAEPDLERSADTSQAREDDGGAPGSEAVAPGSAADATLAPQAGNSALRRALDHTWVRHLILLVVYLGAGIAATWPRFTYLADGKLPATADVSSYVWYLWWTGHQLLHLGNPFFTTYMAAPVGIHFAFTTLMPLAGWIMAPVTVLFGPSASFTLLTIVTPGLLCYAMYRAAKLWLNEPGAIVAGAFFGLSSMLSWQTWYHINNPIGTIFLPITIEAAVRLRRRPHLAPAIALGIALGASILANQESTIVAILLSAVILVPWLVAALIRDRALLRRALKPLGIGAVVAIVVASPELIGMLQQAAAGGASPPVGQLAMNYVQYGVSLPTLFAPSPRLGAFGLGQLASAYSYTDSAQLLEGLPTFGVVLSGLALLGLAVGWRKRSTWAFLALWLVSAALALGTSLTLGAQCHVSRGIFNQPGKVYGRSCHQYLPLMSHSYAAKVLVPAGPASGVWRPVVVSDLMPYTWLTRIPGLAGLREADRFALVGLIGAAMLAGLTVQWLSRRKVTMPLIAVVVALGVLEAGWSGASPTSLGYRGTMPTTLPALDRPLARDHTGSIVVDAPYGLRGGIDVTGSGISPSALLIATKDGHPRAISYTSWVSKAAIMGIATHAFFRYLYLAEQSQNPSPAKVRKAAADLRTMNIGWVVEWRNVWTKHHALERYNNIDKYLAALGFRHVNGMCLVNVQPGQRCPNFENVWLWHYMPGHRG